MNLTRSCPECEGGVIWRSRYGGNDPDVWPVRCRECDGTGERSVGCEGWRCHSDAAEHVAGVPYCRVCAEQLRAELAADAESER